MTLDQQTAAVQRRHRSTRRGLPVALQFQCDAKHRSFSRPARYVDVAVHRFGQRMTDTQAQAGATENAVGGRTPLVEGEEQAGLFAQRDADPGIADRERDHHAMLGFGFEHDADHDLTLIGELDGVTNQIVDDLDYSGLVADQCIRYVTVDDRHQFQVLRMGLRCPKADGRLHAVTQIERFMSQYHLAGFELGKIQNVIDDAQQRVGRLLDHVEIVTLLSGEFTLVKEPGEANDPVHRRADLMAHVREELGFGPVGLDCAAPCQIELGIADLDHLHALLGLPGRLENPLLQFFLGHREFARHQIEASLEFSHLAGRDIGDLYAQFAVADAPHGVVHQRDRTQHVAQAVGRDDQCHGQAGDQYHQANQCEAGAGGADPEVQTEASESEQQRGHREQIGPVIEEIGTIEFRGYHLGCSSNPGVLNAFRVRRPYYLVLAAAIE